MEQFKNKKRGIGHKVSQSFRECPCCGNTQLYKTGIDLICFQCDWNSAGAYVEAGGMNSLPSALIDQFSTNIQAKKKTNTLKKEVPNY